MSERDEDFRLFADAMPGWRYGTPGLGLRWFGVGGSPCSPEYGLLYAPSANDPLHKHMEFVGRIAEAVGYRSDGFSVQFRIGPSGSPLPEPWRVTFRLEAGVATDLAWAAVRAALAARGVK